MSMKSRWMPAVAAVALLSLAAFAAGNRGEAAGEWAEPATPRHLVDLEVLSPAPGQVAVELTTDGLPDYRSFVLEGPDRLVLDLTGTVTDLEAYRHAVGHDGVVQVRVAQHVTDPVPVTRVVVDLERPVAFEVDQAPGRLAVRFDAGAPVADWRPENASGAAGDGVADLIREMEGRAPAAAEPVETARVVPGNEIERLMNLQPAAATPKPLYQQSAESEGIFATRKIVTDETVYTGNPVSLNLVEADIKQVFRLFHEISGLNFVLDPSVDGRVTIVLDDVPWDQALDIILKNNGLDKQLENNVIRIASTEKLAQEASARKTLKEAKELEVEPITITRTLSYAKAEDVERVIRESGVLTPRGRVIVDERTNTLIVSDIPKKVSPLDVLISTLDAETPQVMIEARIVETTRDFMQDLGVNWGFNADADPALGTDTGLNFPNRVNASYGLQLVEEDATGTLGFSFGNVIDSFTLDLALNALEMEGNSRILSAPKIATQNNERAEIEQGVRIPIVNTTATEINVEFVSASLRMVVTPQITAEGTIILEVEVENNSPNFEQGAGGNPGITTQRAQTKVLIADGGTTVIGGIFTVNEAVREVGVPWFRKLPAFKWLFRSKSINNENRELLIFITPRIMRVA